ncbi:hypothetical protein AUG19_06000 [archaeon 13_1_20CM_2_54_9]|nr:MAG: hypothetical protein AUJ07_03020 [Crenarchaeota archaeon 13_1_40CM_3_53_5]OLE75245.1 MAG: hypothetical protein AUG19_06000 [archaeon 13_1_20CM_2_54_9]
MKRSSSPLPIFPRKEKPRPAPLFPRGAMMILLFVKKNLSLSEPMANRANAEISPKTLSGSSTIGVGSRLDSSWRMIPINPSIVTRRTSRASQKEFPRTHKL